MLRLLAAAGRKFAAANALGQGGRQLGGMLFAVGGDQLAENRAKRRFGEGVNVDAVEHRLSERLTYVSERDPARVGGAELFKRYFKGRRHWLAFYGLALRLATGFLKKG